MPHLIACVGNSHDGNSHDGQATPIGDRCCIGRGRGCDVSLDSRQVSRQHARIERLGEDYQIEDLGSRNGTFVNGVRVQAPTRLRAMDRIKICGHVFTFVTDQAGAEGESADPDHETARIVRQHLLPPPLPRVPGWSFHASYGAAYGMGEGFFDVVSSGEDRLVAVVGDVVERGAVGAAKRGRLSHELSLAAVDVTDPEDILGAAARTLHQRGTFGEPVSLLCIALDALEPSVRLSCAGESEPPILKRPDGDAEILRTKRSPPLGGCAEHGYSTTDVNLTPGAALIAFSTAVPRIENAEGDALGVEGVRAALARTSGNAASMVGAVVTAVERFRGEQEAGADDLVILCLARDAPANGRAIRATK